MATETYEQWRARVMDIHALQSSLLGKGYIRKAPRTQLEREWLVSREYRERVRPGLSVYERAEVMAQAERAIMPVNPTVLTWTPEASQNAANQATTRNKPILAITPYQPEQVALAVIGEPQDKRSLVACDAYRIPTSYKNKCVHVLLEDLDEGDVYRVEKLDQYRHHAGYEVIEIMSIQPPTGERFIRSDGYCGQSRYRLAWLYHPASGKRELRRLSNWMSHYEVVGGAKLAAAEKPGNVIVSLRQTTPVWKGTKAA